MTEGKIKLPKTSENFRLSSKQELSILELLNPNNKTLEDIACKIRVTERTIRTWLNLPQFQKRLEQERRRLRDGAFNRLRDILNKSVEGLEKLLDDENPNVKLRACQTILDFNFRVIEIEELEKRIQNLEAYK